VSKKDEYLEHAEECRRLASMAQHDGDRDAWLQLAMGWLKLAEYAVEDPKSH
jgi:hypothetical protein